VTVTIICDETVEAAVAIRTTVPDEWVRFGKMRSEREAVEALESIVSRLEEKIATLHEKAGAAAKEVVSAEKQSSKVFISAPIKKKLYWQIAQKCRNTLNRRLTCNRSLTWLRRLQVPLVLGSLRGSHRTRAKRKVKRYGMTNDLSRVFEGVIAQAAKTPHETGETRPFQRRLEGATDAVLILADVSSSMIEMAGARRKADLLEEALAGVRFGRPQAHVIAFSSWPQEVHPGCPLPVPSGGTALHQALAYTEPFRPRQTLVISDGRPDDEAKALSAADSLTGIIDVIYCGPDGDAEAIAFMRRLARAGGGRVVIHDVVKAARTGPAELTSAVKGLLPPPNPHH